MVVATQPDIPYTHTHIYARTHTHGNKLKRQDKKLQSVAAIILWQLQIVQ